MKTPFSTLEEPKVKTLLERLYAEAEANDSRLMPQVRAAAGGQGVMDDRKLAPLLDHTFMAVAPEVGRLFYLLVRAHKPKLVVEFGTSLGLSAIHIASALRDNGFGRLITAEKNPHKVERAGLHLAAAGLADLVEVRQGNAFETLGDACAINLLVLDGWKALYLPLLKQLEPRLSPGCLIIADDTTLMPEMLAEYLAYVREPANGYISSALPLDDGVELSIL